MSSYQTRQDRFQARLRGAGNTVSTGSFSIQLPREPSPARETAPVPAPSSPGPKELTPRQQTPKQTPKQTPRQIPPTRASPRLTSYVSEAPTHRATRSSSRFSATSPLEQQRRQQQNTWGSTPGQKRKQSDITTGRDLDIPTERTKIKITTPELNTLTTLLSPPAVATRAIKPTTTITTVTPLARRRSTRRPSSDKLDTPQDDGDTRLHDLEGKKRAVKFTSPRLDNSFKVKMRNYEGEDGMSLKAASGTLDDSVGDMEDVPAEGEDDTMGESGLINVEGQGSGDMAVGYEDNYVQLEELEDSFSVLIAGSPNSKKRRKESPKVGELEEACSGGNDTADHPAVGSSLSPQVITREPPPHKRQKPPLKPSGPKSKEQPSCQKGSVEITIQRLSKPKKGIKYTPNIPITPLDVLSQIFKEMFKKQYEMLDNSAEKWALEVFADEVEVRLLDHIDALNAAIQASRELRRYTRLKQQSCEELMALRQELGQIELEIDEVRRKHEREGLESKSKHSISQRLDSIAAAMELSKARAEAKPSQPVQLEGQADLLLRKLAREVTSPRLRPHRRRRRRKRGERGEVGFIDDDDDDGDVEDEEDEREHGDGEESEDQGEDEEQQQEVEMGTGGDGLETGSILERVKGFNRFLEKMEKVVLEASLRR